MSRYIDADAMIADMQERYCKPCKEKGEDYNEVRCRACWVDDAINDADGFADNSIDIEPKRGEWIYGEHDVAMCDGYRCDRCGFFVPWDYEHKSIDFISDYNFCPNCGADMREREGE